jgi:hypothetical protein
LTREAHPNKEVNVRHLRTIAGACALGALVAASVLVPSGGGPSTELAFAQSSGSQVSQLLAQLRRNAKVSERLNAGFFRAPQTRQFAASAFRPLDSDTAFTADRGDSALSLDATRASDDTEQNPQGQTVVKRVPQTTGTFELPLDIPNRAEVVEVQTSYKDAGGGSGMQFQIVKYGQLGDQPAALFGTHSTDGRTGTDTTQLTSNKFRVDNSRNRYVLRVQLDETNPDTRFYGFTIQYVIGKGVPGAPQGT